MGSFSRKSLSPVADPPFPVNADPAKNNLKRHTRDFLEPVQTARSVGAHYFPGNVNCGIMRGDFFTAQTGPHCRESRQDLLICDIRPTAVTPGGRR